jgi:trimethylamine-N-oxide reductase cytochrome c-type subunit TorC
VATAGDATHVKLHGWSAQGADGIVIAAPGKRIVELSNFSAPALRSPGAVTQAEGTAYTAVTIDGWVATSALVDDVQTVWAAAGAAFAQHCSACHALPPVAAYTANQWPGVVKGMAANAALAPDQAALITTYLQMKSGS